MTTIFVAKLDFGVTEDELLTVFKQFGTVSKVTIAKDKETGKPRGFAFIEMPDPNEAQQAIREMDGHAFNGRNCVVKEAEDRGGAPKGRDNTGFKPRGDFQRNEPKPHSRPENKERPKFDNELPPVRPSSDDDVPFTPIVPGKPAPKKKKAPARSGDIDPTNDGKSKKPKMNAYKKSGKDNLFFDEDEDLDEEFDLFGRDEDDEELDDAYSKYVVNSSEDDDWEDDEDWDDDEEWEEEDGH